MALVIKFQDAAYLILATLFFVTFVVMTVGVWVIKNEVAGLQSSFQALDAILSTQSAAASAMAQLG